MKLYCNGLYAHIPISLESDKSNGSYSMETNLYNLSGMSESMYKTIHL